MLKRLVLSALFVLIGVACNASFEPAVTPTPESTNVLEPTPPPGAHGITIVGPDCPDAFQKNQTVTQEMEISAGGAFTLTLGSTPSMPCGWRSPETDDHAVVRQVDHHSQWPAEGVTPQPGAPGTEIWVFEALTEGESTISIHCVCLGEEGEEEKVRGTFLLNVVSVGIQ